MGGAGEVRTVWGAKARAVQRHFDTEPPVVRAVRTTERLQHAWVPAGPVPGSDASPTSTGRGNRPEANPSELAAGGDVTLPLRGERLCIPDLVLSDAGAHIETPTSTSRPRVTVP